MHIILESQGFNVEKGIKRSFYPTDTVKALSYAAHHGKRERGPSYQGKEGRGGEER